MKEYKNRCDLCKRYKKSRIFFNPIHNGKYPYLCKDCWERIVIKMKE